MRSKQRMYKLCTVLVGMLLACSLAGCRSESTKTDATQLPQNLVKSGEPALQMLTEPGTNLFCRAQTEAGFYEVIGRGEKVQNIVYTDYATKSRVYLCNDPGCNHIDDSCPSFLDTRSIEQLFIIENSLYIQNSPTNLDNEPSQLIRMDLDGTNRKSVLTMETGQRLFGGYATDGEILYYTTMVYVEVPEAEQETNDGIEFHLNGMNLRTGESTELYNFGTNCIGDKIWVGCVGREMIFSDTVIPDPEQPKKVAHTYRAFSIDTQQWRDLIQEPIFEGAGIYADGMHIWVGTDGMTLNTLTYDTSEVRQTTLDRKIPLYATMDCVTDGKMLVFWAEKDQDTYVTVDLETGAITDGMFWVSKASGKNGVMKILASFGDEYLVDTDPVDVPQVFYHVDGSVERYTGEFWPQALISKEDYWAGKRNLTMIDDHVKA